MKYFYRGNLLFAIIFSIWRGYSWGTRKLSTWFFRRVISKCGNKTTFGHNIYISHPANIDIGDNCIIGNNVSLVTETSEGRLTVGNNVQISDRVVLDYTGDLFISDNCLLSQGVIIYTHDHGYNPHSIPTPTDLLIEENVWIGFEAVILPGVGKIARNAIIGARSVVTKSVAEGSVLVGNPAKVIQYRDNIQDGSKKYD